MITVHSLSSMPTTKKPPITPSMDARLLKSPTRSCSRIHHSQSLIILGSQGLVDQSSANAIWELKEDSNVYQRHRIKLKENQQSSLNAGLKEEDPTLYAWATTKPKQQGNRKPSRDRKVSRSLSGARRLRKALSFNAKKKTSKVAAADQEQPTDLLAMPLSSMSGHGNNNENPSRAKRGGRRMPKGRSKVPASSKDPSSMSLSSMSWHGDTDAVFTNRAGRGAPNQRTIGRSKSYQPKSTSANESLTVPLHLQAVCKQPANSALKLKRSVSARAVKVDENNAPQLILQRSRSARLSGQPTQLSCAPFLSPQPTMKRSVSGRFLRHSHTSRRGPTSPTLERARSARISRSNSKQLRDFFGSFHRSQTDLQGAGKRENRRRSHHHDDNATGIFKDKEKGYISSFLGSDSRIQRSRSFRRSSGWLV